MGTLKIERIGGLGGFGGPHLKSRGEYAVADLSKTDQAIVEKLFDGGSKAPTPGSADMFRYRITRPTPKGAQTIEVPESLVPAPLANSVKDTLE